MVYQFILLSNVEKSVSNDGKEMYVNPISPGGGGGGGYNF